MVKDAFKDLALEQVLNSEFNPETEIFRSCMRSFFRDKYGNDPMNIRRLYKERIVALHKVKNYQLSQAVQPEECNSSEGRSLEVSLHYAGK